MGTIISLNLQVKKMKLREAKQLAQGHTASKLQSLKLNPCQSDSKSFLLNFYTIYYTSFSDNAEFIKWETTSI